MIGQQSVLVVEDDPNWCGTFRILLQQLGCRVYTAADFKTGREMLSKGPFLLAIIDVSLVPGDKDDKQGLTLVKEAWSLQSAAQLAVLSGYVSRSTVRSELGEGIDYICLDKTDISINYQELKSTLGGLIKGSSTPITRGQELIQHLSEKREDKKEPIKCALIVEDEENWRDLYRAKLELVGFAVQTARAYPDAVGVLRRESFDLAIVDLELASNVQPENLHGVLLLEWLIVKRVPTIIVTGKAVPRLVDAIYREYEPFQILDKSGFEMGTFASYVARARTNPIVTHDDDPVKHEARQQKFERLIEEVLQGSAHTQEELTHIQTLTKEHRLKLEVDEKIHSNFQYDVVLSFAGEDRQYARALTDCLRKSGIEVFYDEYEQADLWGKNLTIHLYQVYSKEGRYCVMFMSQHYKEKVWTSHEFRAALDREVSEKGAEYILPICIDDTELPGLSPSVARVSIQQGIERICQFLLQKLRRAPVSNGT